MQPWPNGREFMTKYDAFYHQLAAQRTWTRRRPLLFTHVTRDRGIRQGIDADDEWSRLSHLGSSESVLHEQAAAVHAAAEHHVTALVKQVSHSLTVAHVWVGDRAHGTGKLGTGAGDTAEVLTDGFRARPAVERSIHYHSSARLGAAGRTGTSAESQGITMVA